MPHVEVLEMRDSPVVSTARGTNACAFCMMSFARIAKSALTCDVSGLAALGTRFLRAFVFPVVSTARGTNACAFCMMSFARIAISALARDVSGLATWYTRAWGMRSCRDSGLALDMRCSSVDNPCIRSHARQSHNDRKPCT